MGCWNDVLLISLWIVDDTISSSDPAVILPVSFGDGEVIAYFTVGEEFSYHKLRPAMRTFNSLILINQEVFLHNTLLISTLLFCSVKCLSSRCALRLFDPYFVFSSWRRPRKPFPRQFFPIHGILCQVPPGLVPVLFGNCCEHHNLGDVLKVSSMNRHGLTSVFFLCCHSGDSAPVNAVCSHLPGGNDAILLSHLKRRT